MPGKKRAKKEEIPLTPIPEPTPEPQTPPTAIGETTVKTKRERKLKIKLPKLEFKGHSALQKLRVGVLVIFLLSTIAIGFVFVNFPIAVVLILIGYLLLFGLLVKLLMVKRL